MDYDGFKLTHQEGNALTGKGHISVLVDEVTGVNYLYVRSGYSGGLTVLVNAEGKPIVTKK